MRRDGGRRALLLAAALWLFRPGAAGTDATLPLTNEEVVRMVAAGIPEAEILLVIAASRPDFELDREVVVELRRAGVSETILRAMKERQSASGATAPQGVPAPVPRGIVLLGFTPLEGSGKPGEKPSFRVMRKTPRWATARLGMEERAEVEDLAVFLLCKAADHVPDHWQNRTPLDDFLRHEVLAFDPGSHPGKSKGFEILVLDLPPVLSVEVPAGRHDLVVGVALKVGPDWHVAGSDARKGVRVEAGRITRVEVKLSGSIVGSMRGGYHNEQRVAIGDVAPPVEGS